MMTRAGVLLSTLAAMVVAVPTMATPSTTAPAGLVGAPIPTADEGEPERYRFSAQVPELEVNTRGEVRIGVEAATDYLLDRQYPFELSFVPQVGDEVLVAKKTSYKAEDGHWGKDDKSLGWTVEVMARKAGSHPVSAKIKLRVCNKDPDLADCVVADAEMRLVVVVKG